MSTINWFSPSGEWTQTDLIVHTPAHLAGLAEEAAGRSAAIDARHIRNTVERTIETFAQRVRHYLERREIDAGIVSNNWSLTEEALFALDPTPVTEIAVFKSGRWQIFDGFVPEAFSFLVVELWSPDSLRHAFVSRLETEDGLIDRPLVVPFKYYADPVIAGVVRSLEHMGFVACVFAANDEGTNAQDLDDSMPLGVESLQIRAIPARFVRQALGSNTALPA